MTSIVYTRLNHLHIQKLIRAALIHAYLLHAAGAPTGGATKRADQAYDLAVCVVFNLHVKAPQRATAVPCAAVILLFGLVDLLAHAVLDHVLIVGLKTDEC